MPLTDKGKKIMSSMQRTHGAVRVNVFRQHATPKDHVEKEQELKKVAGLESWQIVVQRLARVELLRLATTLSPE